MTDKLKYAMKGIFPEKNYRLAFITGFIIILGLLLYRILLAFSYAGEIGGIDNNFVYDVVRNIQSGELYTDPSRFPYAITLYSPLYYNLCTFIGKIIHINADEPINVYRLCRSVSLLCDSITCFLLYMTLKKRTGAPKELSWFLTACFASILCFFGHTFSRSDSLLLTFYALTIYLLTSGSALKKNSHLFLLALVSAGCILSKQNGIIVPVLVVSWLLLHNAKKKAIYYAVFYAILLLTSVLIYLYIFKYAYLFDNTITALRNRIDLSWFYVDIFKRAMNSLWILPLYAAAIISATQWLKSARIQDKSLAWIFIIQTVFSLGTSLKWGSSASYFNESIYLAFIIISYKIVAINTNPVVSVIIRKMITWSLPLFVLFFIHTMAQGERFYLQKQKERKTSYQQQKEIVTMLRPKLQGRYILNLGPASVDFFKTLFYKEMACPNMDMVFCCTLPDNTFDYSLFRQDMSNGNIAYLLGPEKISFSSIYGISLEKYRRDTVLNGYGIYRFHDQ